MTFSTLAKYIYTLTLTYISTHYIHAKSFIKVLHDNNHNLFITGQSFKLTLH